MLNTEILEEYKQHPRILEVRLILLFDLIEKEYGFHNTMKIFSAICESFHCNIGFITSIVNKRFEIKKRSKNQFVKWRQEVLFTAACYGESTYKVARDYLHVTPSTLYAQSQNYNLEIFCTEEWLIDLDSRIALCGEKTYRMEVVRFLEVIDMFGKVLEKWRVD